MAFAPTPALRTHAPLDRGAAAKRSDETRRAREFRIAKRHSLRVRILKGLLPALAMGILSLYLLPPLLKTSINKGRGTASVRSVTLEAGSLKMLDPRVQGVNDRNEPYDFQADSATQASGNTEEMFLENVRGHMTAQDGAVTTLTAPNAVHNNKAEQMTFNNGAVVKRGADMTATFKSATAYVKKQTVISTTPVIVRLHESTIDAETMTMFWGEQRAVFEGNVRTHLERRPEETMKAEEPSSPSGWAAGMVPAR